MDATPRSFIRFGYGGGMTRSRNGAVALHAASCLPAVTGAWRHHQGGGALLSTSDNFCLNTTLVEATDVCDPAVRTLNMSQLGRVLTEEAGALAGGPPVTAMLVQNANPAVTAPESARVRQGLARKDLFLCVHEQFLTDTAQYADVIRPATIFLEDDDLYTSYGHTFLQVASAVIPPVGESRSNHDVINALVPQLGGHHASLALFDSWTMIDWVLAASGQPLAAIVQACGRLDCARPFAGPHFIGFPQPSGRFRFTPNWASLGFDRTALPTLPDHALLIEEADETRPLRLLITAPTYHLLNSTFAELLAARRQQEGPTVLIHPEDCKAIGITDSSRVCLGNQRGVVTLHARIFDAYHEG